MEIVYCLLRANLDPEGPGRRGAGRVKEESRVGFHEVIVGCSGTRKQNTSPPTSQKWTQAKDTYNKLGRLFQIPTMHDTNARSLRLAVMYCACVSQQ
jgi:hypothetical protein